MAAGRRDARVDAFGRLASPARAARYTSPWSASTSASSRVVRTTRSTSVCGPDDPRKHAAVPIEANSASPTSSRFLRLPHPRTRESGCHRSFAIEIDTLLDVYRPAGVVPAVLQDWPRQRVSGCAPRGAAHLARRRQAEVLVHRRGGGVRCVQVGAAHTRQATEL